ncbi:9458_t:CDS:2 [Funneliformis geosporum]|uniref:3284_t:CDS:1 n=1 Tax=Funneliformis geosporum TaxID=1117311 RepID=A0A9W4SG73_9GLOM|nr:3284_t:CDS:2 [Funneliformis geosporum]CAI2190561.1 9458_t:CDS:2 [Funneliformis geosporum]
MYITRKLFSIKPLLRHSFKSFTPFSTTQIHPYNYSTRNFSREILSRVRIYVVQSRGFHNNRVCLVQKKIIKKIEKEEKIEEEQDTLNLEEDELFPTAILQGPLTERTSKITPDVSPEFYKLYQEAIQKTQKTTPLHGLPRHGRLNNLIYHIQTREDALLLPKAVAQWRKKLLPSTPITTRLIIKKCCEVNSEDVVFQMLTDRAQYALLPSQEGFRRIMLAFANKIVDPSMDEMSLSLNKQEILDNLYKTFGLMTYYDIPQYDVHLYTILISASLKLESWERVDITASELLEKLDRMNNEALELPPIPSDWEKSELLKHDDKFNEYSIESRKIRLKSCIDMSDILYKRYTESNLDENKAESFKKLIEIWNKKLDEQI